MTNLDKAEFICAFPDIMTAIKAGGDGMRIQLDIPENQAGEAVKLFAMKGKQLRATIEVVEKKMRPSEHVPDFEEPYADILEDARGKPKRVIEVK